MGRRPRRQDWEALGLEPGALPGDVRRAYLERRALYTPGAKASYSLLEEDERQTWLDRIEEAYQRITGTPAPVPARTSTREELPAAPDGPPPPLEEHPGAHLRHHRLARSLLLSEVAAEIKVRASLLERLEEEDFGSLPAPVYVRGFVVQYARVLGIGDPDRVGSLYLARMTDATVPD